MKATLLVLGCVGACALAIGFAGRNRFPDWLLDALMVTVISCALSLALVPWVAN